MAGRELTGPDAARPALFRGATWVIVPDGADEEDVERVFAGGADAFLRKPFELHELRDTVLRFAGVTP